MAIFVNTNVSSLNGRISLNNVQNSLNTTFNRLSSGYRINSAKDDAAGLQISDRLTSQINGLNQANRNASDSIALAQTMEGGLDEITNMLQRVRTLAVQASNGTNTTDDRLSLQKEANALTAEITRIANQTTFGGKKILAGVTTPKDGAENDSIFDLPADEATNAPGSVSFQVGANKGDEISLTVSSYQFSDIAGRAFKGAGDADAPELNEDIGFAKVGGGDDGKTFASKADGDPNPFDAGAADKALRLAFSTRDTASLAIASIDKLIADVDSQRSDLGAIQNRLESSIRNQANVSANQADARARIRDTDFAEESANLTQQNIIQQAASSMLMQANMRPQLALSLLG